MAESEHNIHIAQEDLSAYADGETLDPQERSRIEQHLETCEACRQELAELSAIQQLLADLPEPEVPRSFRLSPSDVEGADTDQGPDPTPIQPWLLRHQSTFRAAAMAAALLLALVVTIDLLPGQSGGDDEDAAMDTLDAPQDDVAQQESAGDEAAQDGAQEDAAESAPDAGSDEADDSASTAGDADMETADEPAQEDAPDVGDDSGPPESGDDAAGESGGADGEIEEAAPPVQEEEEEAEQAPDIAQEEEAAEEDAATDSDDRDRSTAGTEEAPATGDDSDVASEPDAPEERDEDYSAEALQETEADEEGISTLRLVAIALAVITILLAAAGFLLPRWWQSASRR